MLDFKIDIVVAVNTGSKIGEVIYEFKVMFVNKDIWMKPRLCWPFVWSWQIFYLVFLYYEIASFEVEGINTTGLG